MLNSADHVMSVRLGLEAGMTSLFCCEDQVVRELGRLELA